jgi:hypothetical protein
MSRYLVKDGSMVAERLLNRSGVELAENVSDGRIGRRPTPFQPEEPAQTNEMDIDETMDTPVRVGPGYHRQNSEQDHMWQTIQLAFSPSRVFDFGQQRQKRGELHGNLGSSDSGCLSKSQRFCVAGILNRLAQRHFTRECDNLDSPFKYRALHSRGGLAVPQTTTDEIRPDDDGHHHDRERPDRSDMDGAKIDVQNVGWDWEVRHGRSSPLKNQSELRC